MTFNNSKIIVGPNDRVFLKPLYKYPVPTNFEVKKFLDLFEDYSEIKLGFLFQIMQGLRPVEVPRLKWNELVLDEQNEKVTKIYHTVYKPMNRRTKIGNNYYFKQVEKKLITPYFSDQLIGYSKHSPKYDFNKMFPWTTEDIFQKHFNIIRKRARLKPKEKKYIHFPELLDENQQQLYGQRQRTYRISPYGFRRFCLTFHYYINFNQDIVATSRYFGHSKPQTTYDHYIMPKESIGLTEEMIKQKITMDEFIHLKGQKQTQLVYYMPEYKKRFIPRGQSTLNQF